MIALDIAYGAAAMATGIAPLLIGLAPVTIALIIASLYSLLWYYIVLPFGTAVFANNPSNFDTGEEQEEFKADFTNFFLFLFEFHSVMATVNGIVYSKKDPSQTVNDFLSPVSGQSISDRILKNLFVIIGIIGLVYMFSSLIGEPHHWFLLIDLGLTVIGLFSRPISIFLLILNLCAALVFGIVGGFLKFF
ncbi:MAG: hypothetical protein D6732_03210 [Methanobacteriota archaeon]|nr:MAG: hypothetical protein D6732_03210 [Euryarchaeota archaeon]